MSGGSGRLPPPAALCPPPPLHGPSLPEAGARSQGRGSPAGHGAPRGAPGARAPPPGERERGPGGLGAGPGVPPRPAAQPARRAAELPSAVPGVRPRVGATGGTGQEGGQTPAVLRTARRIAAAAGGRPYVARPAAKCSGPPLSRCPARRWLFPRRSVGMRRRCEARAARRGWSCPRCCRRRSPAPRPCPPVRPQGLRCAGHRVRSPCRLLLITLRCPPGSPGASPALPPCLPCAAAASLLQPAGCAPLLEGFLCVRVCLCVCVCACVCKGEREGAMSPCPYSCPESGSAPRSGLLVTAGIHGAQ